MENEHSRKLQSAIKLTDPSPFSPVSFHHRKKEKKKEEISDLSCHDVQPVESRRPFSFFILAPFASSSGAAFIQTPLRVLRASRCSRDTISISRRAREIAGVCPLRRDLSLEISALFVPENNNWPGTEGGVVRENLPCFSFSRSPNTPSLSVHPPFIFSTSLRAHIASFDHVHEIVDMYNTFGKFVLKVDAIEFE